MQRGLRSVTEIARARDAVPRHGARRGGRLLLQPRSESDHRPPRPRRWVPIRELGERRRLARARRARGGRAMASTTARTGGAKRALMRRARRGGDDAAGAATPSTARAVPRPPWTRRPTRARSPGRGGRGRRPGREAKMATGARLPPAPSAAARVPRRPRPRARSSPGRRTRAGLRRRGGGRPAQAEPDGRVRRRAREVADLVKSTLAPGAWTRSCRARVQERRSHGAPRSRSERRRARRSCARFTSNNAAEPSAAARGAYHRGEPAHVGAL